jgi:hypothetical protein
MANICGGAHRRAASRSGPGPESSASARPRRDLCRTLWCRPSPCTPWPPGERRGRGLFWHILGSLAEIAHPNLAFSCSLGSHGAFGDNGREARKALNVYDVERNTRTLIKTRINWIG